MSSVTKLNAKAPEPLPEFSWGPAEPHFGCSKRLGRIANADESLARDKRRIWARIGNLSGIRLYGNRVLVAIWVPGEKKTGSIILVDNTADEDKWQGKTGMVVGLGPQAFKSDENRTFLPEEIPVLGDWVLMRKGDGHMLQVWGHECMMMDDTAIRAVLDRPDAVY